jgi:leucyl-tRNA synthetase
MAVPAHDERDFEFARKYSLPVIQVVSHDGSLYDMTGAETGEGIAVNSGEFNGMKTDIFRKKITAWLEKKNLGQSKVNYKLRDWVFSRQRYWGEPIPVVHCDKCGIVPLDERDLPLKLPDVKTYKPTGTGESPLAGIEEWVNTTCPRCGGKARRETNTMPQWAGSCWYYIRFTDAHNDKALAGKEKINYWLPVDLYIGGAEHAVLHLLYARFWHKFLFDIRVVNTPEPFMSLRNQGMILGENGEKMSKSHGNVINPDDVVREYGADTFRIYEMFMGPLASDKPWNMQSIIGIKRFLDKAWKLFEKPLDDKAGMGEELIKLRHRTVKTVTEKIEALEFNTAISQLMIFVNALHKEEILNKTLLRDFAIILHPFAPFVTEEMWEMLGEKPSILINSKWPSYDPEMIREEFIEIAVQENGKLRDTVLMPKGASPEEMIRLAMESERLKLALKDKEIKRIIPVPGKVVNVVSFGRLASSGPINKNKRK